MSNKLSNQLTEFLPALLAGDDEAFSKVFSGLFEEVCQSIEYQFNIKHLRHSGSHDIANSVFLALHQAIQDKRLRELNDSRHLLGVLKLIAKRKTLNLLRAEKAERNGNGKVSGESVFADGGGIAQAAIAKTSFNPQYIANMRDHWQRLMNALSSECQAIALGKLYNKTNEELAKELSLSLATIERRLVLIRTIWLSIE